MLLAAADALQYFGTYAYLRKHLHARAESERERRGQPTNGEGDPLGMRLVASAAAGAVGVLVTNPLWLAKTRLQLVERDHRGRVLAGKRWAAGGVFSALAHAWRTEGGPRAWWRATMPAMLGVSHGVVQLLAYEELRGVLAARRASEGGAARRLSPQDVLMASAASKVFATVSTYPYQVVRSRMQAAVGLPTAVPSVVSTARALLRKDGVRGFYRGLAPNILRTVRLRVGRPSAA